MHLRLSRSRYCAALLTKCTDAVVHSQTRLLEWLRNEKRVSLNSAAVVEAVLQRVDLPLLKWLYTKVQSATFKEALQHRDANVSLVGKRFVSSIAILTWLHTHRCLNLDEAADQKLIADAAIVDGHLHTLKWICSKGHELDYDTMNDLQHEAEPALEVSNYAARNGHLNIVQFMHEQECQFHQLRRAAAQSGSVPLMRYLIEQNIGEWGASGRYSLQAALCSWTHRYDGVLA
eukprot:8247-Heterococcus_DN1.PRE.1